MRLLVCGSRNLDATHLPAILRWIRKARRPGISLLHGDGPPGDAPGAIGADKLAEVAATLAWWEQHFEIRRFPADWRTHGRKAGPLRNQQMLDDGQPQGWLAFHTDPGLGVGTADMVRRLRAASVPGRVVML